LWGGLFTVRLWNSFANPLLFEEEEEEEEEDEEEEDEE
jgi:hypothetical protein